GEGIGIAQQSVPCRVAARRRNGMHGDQEILPEEEVEVGGLEIERVGRRLVEVDARHHYEDVAVVLFQLDAGARRKRVLDGEGVEFEHLLEQRVLVEV